MRRIFLGRAAQYETMVSDEDYDHLIQWRWSFGVSHKAGGLVYARRSIWLGGKNVTLLMHHVVMERAGIVRPDGDDKWTADHIDGDSLNNCRDNLQWATHKMQMQPHRRRGIRNEPRDRALDDIPF